MDDRLGPQNPGDGPLLRRVRLHQSWYRAEVLGLARWGSTPGRNPRELGSVLTVEDAAAGMNFGTPEVFDLYRTRHTLGWGIDPRCSSHMTSSQALTINLLGLLNQDMTWFLDCLNEWLCRTDLKRISSFDLEFAPARRSLHLNDQTRIDALVRVEGKHGAEVVAVEVKYADRFNSRHVDVTTEAYRQLARRSGLWAVPVEALADRRVNQLARIHALATSYGMSVGIAAPASLLVLSHELDAGAIQVVDEYRDRVNGPLVHRTSLRQACTSMFDSAPVRLADSARTLDLRYGAEHEGVVGARSQASGSGRGSADFGG